MQIINSIIETSENIGLKRDHSLWIVNIKVTLLLKIGREKLSRDLQNYCLHALQL